MKKLISLLLSVAMTMSVCTFSVHAEGDTSMAAQYLNASAYSEKLGTVIMGGRYSAVLTSQDGVNFGRTYTGSGIKGESFVIGNAGLEQIMWVDEISKFVVLDADNTNKTKTNIGISSDGVKWTKYLDVKCNSASVFLSCINYVNGEFVAAGNGGNIYTSKDLQTWTKVTETGVLEAVNESYANSFFSGIITSTPDENGRKHILFYTDPATFGVKGSTNVLFAGDSDMGEDWYNYINEVSTLDANGVKPFNRIFDLAWSDNGYFYGVGTVGANGEYPFKYDPEYMEFIRSKGSTYPFGGGANAAAKGTLAMIEDGDRFVIGTLTGKIFSFPVDDAKAFSGLPTLTEITPADGATALATNERLYHFVKTKWGLLSAASKTTGMIVNIGESTYSTISNYYKNTDGLFIERPDAEPTDEMVKVTKNVGMKYVADMYDKYRGCIDSVSSVFASDPRRAAYMASLATMLHKYSGKEQYINDATEIVSELLEYWSDNAPTANNEFFTWGAFAEAYAYVRDAGKIDACDAVVAGYINRLTASNTGNDHHNTDNQSLLRARSVMKGLKLLDSEYEDEWTAYVKNAYDRVLTLGGTNENATGYNGLTLFAIYEIAKEMGYSVPKKLFENFAHQVAPSGAMPEYGDDYFNSWYECLPALMFYAREYNDGGVWYTADKLFHFGCNNYNIDKTVINQYTMMMNLYSVAKAYETECNAENYGEPGYTSEITKRNTPYGEEYDKLILRNGNAFAMVDLYARGAHANNNAKGAVVYYERDSVPVYHGMARHNRSAESFSMPIVTDSETLEIVKNPTEGEWYTENYPLTLLDPDGDGEADINKLTFRLVPSGAEEYLYIDNIRLTGKNGTLILDNCSEAWTTRSGVFSVDENVTSDGDGSVKINMNGQNTFAKYFYKTPVYGKQVTISEYDTLSYDWCYSSSSQSMDFEYVIRLENADENLDFYPNSINIMPTLKSAKVETRQDMQYAVVEFENYGGYGIELKKEYALYSDGTLFVKNSFGKEVGEKYVHNLQHFYGDYKMSGTTAVTNGEDKVWYDTTAHKADEGETYIYMPNTTPSVIEIGNITNSDIVTNALCFTKKLAGSDKLSTLITDTKQSKTADCITTDEAIFDISSFTPGYAKAAVSGDSFSAYVKVRSDNDAKVYIAEYDGEGTLIGVHTEDAKSSGGILEHTSESYKKTGEEIKVFVWSGNNVPVVWKN